MRRRPFLAGSLALALTGCSRSSEETHIDLYLGLDMIGGAVDYRVDPTDHRYWVMRRLAERARSSLVALTIEDQNDPKSVIAALSWRAADLRPWAERRAAVSVRVPPGAIGELEAMATAIFERFARATIAFGIDGFEARGASGPFEPPAIAAESRVLVLDLDRAGPPKRPAAPSGALEPPTGPRPSERQRAIAAAFAGALGDAMSLGASEALLDRLGV